jgi:hypothetical protein
MEYPQLAGRTIERAKSWTEEEGVTYMELTFTDGTRFNYATKLGIQTWARTMGRGEVTQTWE